MSIDWLRSCRMLPASEARSGHPQRTKDRRIDRRPYSYLSGRRVCPTSLVAPYELKHPRLDQRLRSKITLEIY